MRGGLNGIESIGEQILALSGLAEALELDLDDILDDASRRTQEDDVVGYI